MDALTAIPDAVGKITNFFRPSVWSQASTAQSSTAATPLNSDNDTFREGVDRPRTRQPSLVWAMQSHRSIPDQEPRDYCLHPGYIEQPTGRLTSVDPRFPTDCHMDKMWSFCDESMMPTQFTDYPTFRKEEKANDNIKPKANDDIKRKASDDIKQAPRSEGYVCDESDLLDQHVAYCLRHQSGTDAVVRLEHGKYRINKREVKLRWIDGVGGERGHLEVLDGPMKQPLADYLEGKEETAVYEEAQEFAIGDIPKEQRLSFGDEQYQSYTRLEAMRVAKEQAKLRESAAQASLNNFASVYQNHEDHMNKYRTWHKAQLQSDAPLFQQLDADDAQVVNMLQAPERTEGDTWSGGQYRASRDVMPPPDNSHNIFSVPLQQPAQPQVHANLQPTATAPWAPGIHPLFTNPPSLFGSQMPQLGYPMQT